MSKEDFKFDVVIGNPPYQEETIGDNKTFAPPVYHKFLDEAYKVGNIVDMITPARFLFNAGSTPKKWNKKMLSDDHLKVLFYEQDSSKVFENTDIKGGVAVTYRDDSKALGPIGTFTPIKELRHIIDKVVTDKFVTFNTLIFAPESYKLTDKLHSDYPDAIENLSKGHKYDISTNIFDKLGNIFHQVKQHNDVGIYGRENNKRVLKWISLKYIKGPENFKNYKVFVPKSNGSGTLGEKLTTPLIGKPLIGATQTFISIGNFKTKDEAEAVLKYIKTKFSRVMLGTLKVTQDNKKATWKNVPMQDFTSSSDIDWSKSISEIDQQLYKKYDLSEEEIDFIETHVKEMD